MTDNGQLESTSSTIPRFVFVMNRNRDGYEVPLALEEAGLLECFVTDFYAPERPAFWLPGFLRRRTRAGLPHARVRPSWSSFLVQYISEVLRLPMHRVFPIADGLLAKKAAKEARARRVGLYAYSSYLDSSAKLPTATVVVDFEYHPHPDYVFELLKADFAKYPEVAWSFEIEAAAHANELTNNAWRRANGVVCASNMTRKSLEYAGCDPAKITVIPYGLDDKACDVRDRSAGQCKFLFVGQGLQRKGLHHLAHAWSIAAPLGATLTVVSYRTDPGIQKLLDLPGIRVLGYQDREALEALYAESDVFIMPSIVEGFGLVYLEALRHGCHVVATENTGVVDLGLSPSAATIVPVGGITQLVDAITDLTKRKAARSLNPGSIRNEALRWKWQDFRSAISDHAERICTQHAADAGIVRPKAN